MTVEVAVVSVFVGVEDTVEVPEFDTEEVPVDVRVDDRLLDRVDVWVVDGDETLHAKNSPIRKSLTRPLRRSAPASHWLFVANPVDDLA